MTRTPPFTMTRQRTWWMTGISAALFAALSAIFGDHLFAPSLWNASNWIDSPLVTYLMLLAIFLVGASQARRLPADGVGIRLEARPAAPGQINDPLSWRLLLGNDYFALLWLPLRFFLGRYWVASGVHKLGNPGWMAGGDALKGFWAKQVVVPASRPPPIAYPWFRQFLQYMLDHGWYTWFAKLIAFSETLVGLGLLVGALVGLAAFCGTFMNFNYLLAGATSANPVLFGLGVLLVIAWKVAGFWGLDRWLLLTSLPREHAAAQVGALSQVAAREMAQSRSLRTLDHGSSSL